MTIQLQQAEILRELANEKREGCEHLSQSMALSQFVPECKRQADALAAGAAALSRQIEADDRPHVGDSPYDDAVAVVLTAFDEIHGEAESLPEGEIRDAIIEYAKGGQDALETLVKEANAFRRQPSAALSQPSRQLEIYLVRGESGEYDDWRRWDINAHPTLESAQAEAGRLTALQADWRAKYLAIDIDSTEDWFERREAVQEESRAVWCDASDDIKFDVEAIPFAQSAALVPQGCQTCATCRFYKEGWCDNQALKWVSEPDPDFGCIAHEPKEIRP